MNGIIATVSSAKAQTTADLATEIRRQIGDAAKRGAVLVGITSIGTTSQFEPAQVILHWREGP